MLISIYDHLIKQQIIFWATLWPLHQYVTNPPPLKDFNKSLLNIDREMGREIRDQKRGQRKVEIEIEGIERKERQGNEERDKKKNQEKEDNYIERIRSQ